MTASLPPHLTGLLDSGAYAHPTREIRIIETHISWVVLTGDYAYKIKRPVRFPFLDFTSLARREFFCREELRLNQRFATELYLAVCPIVRRGQSLQMNGAGEAVEFAVRMRQFDAANELGFLLEHGHVSIEEIEEFGRAMADVHETLPRLPSHSEPQRTRRILLENAAECGPDKNIGWCLRDELDRLRDLLVQRDAEGFVRECHGDLHASNVARIDGRLRAFDCLEFEPEFRRIDVAHELAFLAMDLCAHSRPTLASAFVNAWLARSGDYQACECLNLYEAHCALVRAKVAGLNALRVEARGRAALVDRRSAFMTIANERLRRRAPALVLMHGLSGSGKSWLAQRLARELPAICIRSDIERKRLAGLEAHSSSGSDIGSKLYSATQTEIVYERLTRLARCVLSGARTTIVDATFAGRDVRRQFVSLAGELGISVVIVACQAPLEVMRTRIVARHSAAQDASEATLAVLDWQRQREAPLTADEGVEVIEAHTERVDVLHDVLTRLRWFCR